MPKDEQDIGLTLTVGSFGRISVEATKGGRRVSPFSPDLPSALRQLTKNTFSYESTESMLIDFLNQPANHDIPLFLNIQFERTALRWDPELHGESKTTFEITGDQVKLCRVVDIHDTFGSRYIRIGKCLLVDSEEGRLGYVTSDQGWEPWKELWIEDDVDEPTPKKKRKKGASILYDDLKIPVHVSLDAFNHYQAENVGLKDFLVPAASQGEVDDVRMLQQPVAYQLQIQVDDWDNRAQVIVTGVVDHQVIGLDKQLFDESYDVYKFLFQAQKKGLKALAGEAFFTALHESDLALKDVLTPLLNESFPRAESWVKSAREKFGPFKGKKEPKMMVKGTSCVQYELDMSQELNVYELLLTHLGDGAWEYKNTMLDISMPRMTLMQRLDALYQACEGTNISILWDGGALDMKTLDVKLSVKVNRDWFSLHPEVFSGGTQLSSQILQKMVEGKGMYKDNDKVIMLTQASKDMLEHLYSVAELEKDSKRQIVKLNRLQILDVLMMQSMGVEINLPKKFEYLLQLADKDRELPKRPIPKGLQGELRHYQAEGYFWIAYLYELGFGGCLADDMGLGKTLQTLTFLAAVRQKVVTSSFCKASDNPFLIVLPPSLKFVWGSEVEKFFPDMTWVDYSLLEKKSDYKKYDIVLVTYDMVRRDIKWFKSKYFPVVIFDEAQLIKNIYTGRTAAVRQLDAGFKLCLTGTPIENHLGEYYSIIDLAVPGLLESYETFQQYLRQQEAVKDYTRLINRTQPFVLRRVKEKILEELPEKTEQNIVLDMSDSQKALYKRIVNSVRKQVSQAYESQPKPLAVMTALTAILRLRQLCVAPSLVDPNLEGELSPKVTYLLEQLKSLKHEGHSALIFSQFRQFMDILEDEFIKHDIPYIRMDGKTPVSKRKSLVDRFQNSEEPLFFLISLKTGGVGLNLTKASYVYHLDPWWNPSVEEQASDRVYRIGQTQKVLITRLIIRHSVEEKIMLLKEEKQTLFNSVLEKGVATKAPRRLTQQDFEFLIS